MGGRPPAMTKLGSKRVRPVRCRGGNMKYRALRLDAGNYSWGSENCTRKARILDVVYNASNNEMVRTKCLVKKAKKADGAATEEIKVEKKSGHVAAKLKAREAE